MDTHNCPVSRTLIHRRNTQIKLTETKTVRTSNLFHRHSIGWLLLLLLLLFLLLFYCCECVASDEINKKNLKFISNRHGGANDVQNVWEVTGREARLF